MNATSTLSTKVQSLQRDSPPPPQVPIATAGIFSQHNMMDRQHSSQTSGSVSTSCPLNLSIVSHLMRRPKLSHLLSHIVDLKEVIDNQLVELNRQEHVDNNIKIRNYVQIICMQFKSNTPSCLTNFPHRAATRAVTRHVVASSRERHSKFVRQVERQRGIPPGRASQSKLADGVESVVSTPCVK